MKKIFYIIVLAMPFVFPGCNLWEDRASCPKILALDCSMMEGKALGAELWIFKEDGSLAARTSITEHEFYRPLEFEVEAGKYRCAVWGNVGSNTITSDISSPAASLYKAANVSSDPLFSFYKEVECYGDSVYVRAIPKKMFIDVFLNVKGLKSGESVSVDLQSPFGGFTLQGREIEQQSSVMAEGEALVPMRMLRPKSLEGIVLHVCCSFLGEEEVHSDFELGKHLQAADYDLSALDPKDVYITLDVTKLGTFIIKDPMLDMPPVFMNF